MSEEVSGEMSTEPMSTEIGSGAAEAEAISDAGLATEIDGAVVDELASDVEEAVEAGASDAEIQSLIETFKLNVYGEEKEVTLDWNDKEDIIRRLQIAEGGQQSMQRAAEMEKNFENEIQGLVNDPWAKLEAMGFDVDALAEERIQQQIAQLQKSPEQLAQDARDKELEDLRQRLKSQDDERRTIEQQRLDVEAEQTLESQVTDALSATSDLPKSPYVVKRIADAMLVAMDNGRDDVTAADVIPWVQKEINEELQGLFGAMPDKVLEQYLGTNTIDRLRKGRIAKMKTNTSIKDSGSQPAAVKTEAKKKIKINDWFKHGANLNDLE